MARRKVDPAMLGTLVKGAEDQEISRGPKRTSDPNFPVFATPVNQDILVYVPRTNVVAGENGEEMKMLPVHIHDWHNGKQYGQLRCINNLVGDVYEQLGYDGTCPACEATQECWELYNIKLEAEARKLGIDPQNDPADALKSVREKILDEMAFKNIEEYVVFPIVVIPTSGKLVPTEDALKNLQPQFVVWRKQRYIDNIEAALDTLMENPGHPAGMFMMWKFSYDTKGKQATPRDSAKNAKYSIIQDAKALKSFEKFIKPAEDASKEFTLVKAAEVVTAVEFLFYDDLESEVNKLMIKTRQLLEIAKNVGGQQQTQIAGSTNPLTQIGINGTNANVANMGAAPANMGGASPVQMSE